MNEILNEIIDKNWRNKSLKEIIKASPEALLGVSKEDSEMLKKAFNIDTIEDMATNKFFLWAQSIYTLAKEEK